MDLQVTTLTLTPFDLANIKILHLEPTTACNAACPQCAREDINFYNDAVHRSELTLDQVQSMFPAKFIAQLDKLMMCGNFGEPAISNHTVKIFKWARSINPSITLGMNTNGGLRTTTWWRELGKLFNQPTDYVVFSIDGLDDTNHVYRRNVNWKNLVRNAEAFITAGGSAHWDMLIYQHNEHQVDQAQQLAKDMGFKWFRAKVSNRFSWRPVDFLRPPKSWVLDQSQHRDTIRCHALEEKSLYVCATGEIMPCCFIGPHVFNRDRDLAQALATPGFQTIVDRWITDPLPICQQSCSVKEQSQTNFERQWRREVQLS
jgi:MoaA/NifB/PqqE/SkfB family radical SAM enzyme